METPRIPLNNSTAVTYAGGWTQFHDFVHKLVGLPLCIQPARPAQNICSHQNHNQQNVPLTSPSLPTHVWSGIYMPLLETTHTYPMGHIPLCGFLWCHIQWINSTQSLFPTVSLKKYSCHTITCIHTTYQGCINPRVCHSMAMTE